MRYLTQCSGAVLPRAATVYSISHTPSQSQDTDSVPALLWFLGAKEFEEVMIGPSAVFGRVAIEQMSAGAFHTAEGGRMEQADSGLLHIYHFR